MKRGLQRISKYLYDTSIDINERLGVFFINIGIVAALFGVLICLLAHAPVSGTIVTALIAVMASLAAAIARHTQNQVRYGSAVAVMIIIMIPIVWLTTGAESGGTGFWFLYELFYINLFARKRQILPYTVAAVLVQAAAIAADWLHPELFFHFSNQADALISRIGSGAVVTVEIMITVYVQKMLYNHEREINTKTVDMTRSFVTSIANTIDTKDLYTGGHSRRVAECAAAIARNLGMSVAEADNMYFVALLHDIGKIGIPDSVLNKPGRLTAEEYAMIRKHPVYGAEILKGITEIPHVCEGVLHHHERYDGTGYPDGLKGEEIPFCARIITVADSYDAMSSTRIYRKYIRRDDIINDMIRCSGTQFDPHIVDVFVKMLKDGFTIRTENAADPKESGLVKAAGEMMRHIAEDDELTKARKGATSVDNSDFTKLFDYLCNLSSRYGNEMVLVNIGLQTSGEPIESGALLDCMADLNTAITQNTRTPDICTCSSPSSFLVLLVNAPSGCVDQVIGRIRADFIRLHGDTEMTLCHNTVKIYAQAAEDEKA